MAWDVNDLYNFTKFLTRKNQSGGISATDFFFAWNAEQFAYHNDLIGKWQGRNNTKTGLNTGIVLNETVMTDLAPFTLNKLITIAAGVAAKPNDFEIRLAARIGDKKVTFITHGQIAEVEASVIDPPSVADTKYYAIEYEDNYSLLPSSVTGSLSLDYVASPSDVVWAFILDSDGRQIYDAGNSVQSKWAQTTNINITKRALVELGVSFHDRDFSDFGAKNIITGDS